jgi:hypothetical protein
MKNILKEKMEKALKKLSILTCQELIKAYEKGELIKYVRKEALSIQKDEDGHISHIVFTQGGPYVHLDLAGDNFSCVVSEGLEYLSKSAIPMNIWSEMKSELEGYYETDTNKKQLIHYDNIIEMATKYIAKYVDTKFNSMYWISGKRRGHGSADYDEMPKIILHIMREQLFVVVPLLFEDEKALNRYEMMKERLNNLPEKMNTKYIEIHQINIEEIRKDVSLTLCRSFRPTSNMGVL